MNADEKAIEDAAKTIMEDIQNVLAEAMQVGQIHQDSRYEDQHVCEYLRRVLRMMLEAIESRESTIERRLTRLHEHYERMSCCFPDDDIRGPMMAQAAKDMRLVIEDTKKDKGIV